MFPAWLTVMEQEPAERIVTVPEVVTVQTEVEFDTKLSAKFELVDAVSANGATPNVTAEGLNEMVCVSGFTVKLTGPVVAAA